MGNFERPPIPYTIGRTFRIQPHETPPPTPVTPDCCLSGQAGRIERSALSLLDRCVRSPPLPGSLGARFLDIKVLDPIRVGDYQCAQVFLAEALENQSLQSEHEHKIVVAKLYDPLYVNDVDGYLNPFLCVDKHYTHEVHTYKLFAEFQGGLVPEFYGSFLLDLHLPGSESEIRTIEHTSGLSMMQANPSDFSQQRRQHIIKSVIDFETMGASSLCPRQSLDHAGHEG